MIKTNWLKFVGIGLIAVVFVFFQNCSNASNFSATSADPAIDANGNNSPNSTDPNSLQQVNDFSKLELRNTTTDTLITDGKITVNESYIVSFAPNTVASDSILSILVSTNSTATCTIQRLADENSTFSGKCISVGKLVVKVMLSQKGSNDISQVLEFQVQAAAAPVVAAGMTTISASTADLNSLGYNKPQVISLTDGRILPNFDTEISYSNYPYNSFRVKDVKASSKSSATCSVTAQPLSTNVQLRKFILNCTSTGELVLELELFENPNARYEHKIEVVDPVAIWEYYVPTQIGWGGIYLYAESTITSVFTGTSIVKVSYPINSGYINYYSFDGANSFVEAGLYAPTNEIASRLSAEIVNVTDRSDRSGQCQCEIRNTVPNFKPNGVLSLYCENSGSVTVKYNYQLLKTSVSKSFIYELY